MSTAALEGLIACEERFIASLDGDDIGALERALQDIGEAVSRLAASGAWRTTGETGAHLQRALRLAEAARGRINYLADRNRRRLDKLARLAGAPRVNAYQRTGRFG